MPAGSPTSLPHRGLVFDYLKPPALHTPCHRWARSSPGAVAGCTQRTQRPPHPSHCACLWWTFRTEASPLLHAGSPSLTPLQSTSLVCRTLSMAQLPMWLLGPRPPLEALVPGPGTQPDGLQGRTSRHRPRDSGKKSLPLLLSPSGQLGPGPLSSRGLGFWGRAGSTSPPNPASCLQGHPTPAA